MFKYIVVVCAIIACTLAKPSVYAPIGLHAAPVALAAAPIVTATSSQYQVRNYNHVLAAPIIAAPAPLAAAPLVSSYTYSNSWNYPYAAHTYVI